MRIAKTILMFSLLAGLSQVSFAEDQGAMQGKSHGHDMPSGADTRTELKLPDQMKVMQKAMMRIHMDEVGRIADALAKSDLKTAANISKEHLGWNEEEAAKCEKVSKMTGQEDFMRFAKNMHDKADSLAIAAGAGDRDKALGHLAELIGACNACHNKFRH
ncbi:MAG: cytochrome c [Deltaproteobacteria bacterium]|nr:cytochrome c [Deltaproteobacteria bacterium]